jgi:dsDNA-specific endonuclease/ATPase MutS2
MAARFAIGDAVQTPFGKGVIREVRNHGRLLVDVHGRALVVEERALSRLEGAIRKSRTPAPTSGKNDAAGNVVSGFSRTHEIDLHGLTVEEALARVERALNDALLADAAALRVIHGRRGGRIRAALHRRLGEIPTVRSFGLDPQNDGVTVVRL